MAKKNFYAAVFKDGTHRIYSNWPDCQRATSGVADIKFKGFATRDEAHAWIALSVPGEASLNVEETPQQAAPGDAILIYVDGSYIHKRCKRAGWAWLAVKDGQVIAKDSGVTEDDALSRNIDGELEAAIQAMDWAARNGNRAVICHDYSGIAMWASGAWQVKAEISKSYVERIRHLKSGITFRKVVGHSGDKFNDMVDQLAGEAIASYLDKSR
ncbi:MAG: rhnA [Fibrobacteres bacterium]|nr:rhnA [Fibrobacterota bacterium]